MKSERRHELQQNVLDSELSKIVGFFKAHANTITWALLIIAVAALAATFGYRSYVSSKIELQDKYQLAVSDSSLSPADQERMLKELAGQSSDERIAALANVALGDGYAYRAIAAGDKPVEGEVNQLLSSAESYYAKAATYSTSNPQTTMAVAKAYLGLARLAETRGQLDKAKENYQKIRAIQSLDATPVMIEAETSLANLETLGKSVRMATTAPASSAEATTQAAAQPAAKAPVTSQPAAK